MTRSSDGRTRAFYDNVAADYDTLLDTPDARRHHACFWRAAAAVLPPKARLLDFGAATALDAQHRSM